MSRDEVTLKRLEDQIAWYRAKASRNQKRYRVLKTLAIVGAAAIPVLVSQETGNWVSAQQPRQCQVGAHVKPATAAVAPSA